MGFGGFQSGGFEDINDIFGSFFGGGFGSSQRRQSGPRKGEDRLMQLRVDFMDAIFGKTESISFGCGGTMFRMYGKWCTQ